MRLQQEQIEKHNNKEIDRHNDSLEILLRRLEERKFNVDKVVQQLTSFQVAIPSWALGAGGTRFGRFSIGGEPGSLEQKIDDVGLLHALNRSSGAISLHIPWDIPEDTSAVREQANELDLVFDAVNSNTFQDQPGLKYSYKSGSLSHTDAAVRRQAVDHNIEVIRYGEELGSKAITVWLADGSSFPGQQNFRQALRRTLGSLEQIYGELPQDWKMLIEYKPYEPHFYSTVIPDWGTSFLLASRLGEQASTLVDLGHHLPNTNVEQIVATLLMENKLGGFHFNDSRYGDDDLTTGSINPYQLFLIFSELLEPDKEPVRSSGPEHTSGSEISGITTQPDPPASFFGISWMIDASHNVKDPLEDLLQSVESIKMALAQALLIDREALQTAREDNDVTAAQEIMQDAYRTDVRPLLRESRIRSGAAADPIRLYRELGIRAKLIKERGKDSKATGL